MNACLGYWKRSSEVDEEILLQVAHSNLFWVHDQLTPTENPRTRSDKGGAKLHDNMQDEKEIGDGAKEGDGDAEAGVGGEASGASDRGKEEVERVDEERENAGDEEDVVPVSHNVAVGCEDLVPP